jgi:DNA-binding HxlR family transcriptional regulator
VDTDPVHSPPDPTPYAQACPSRTIVDVLANKWVLYVLGQLERSDRPLRFNELRRSVEGVTQKSLTKTLRTLERDGFVDRRVHATVPPRVEYRLTDLGREAGSLLGAIAVWSKENAPRVVAAREAYVAAPAATATPWTARPD